MVNNRAEELKRIKAWIEERKKKNELNMNSGENNIEESKSNTGRQNTSNEDSSKNKYPKNYKEWPEEIQKRWSAEYELQKRFSNEDKQGLQIRRYLEWFEKIPWGKDEMKPINITNAQKVLEEEHYGMRDVKQIILEVVAVQELKKENKGLILLLSGPPGVGKTSFAKSIAKAMDEPFKKIAMGGMSDEVLLKGADRAYMNSFPGAIIRTLCECGSNSPVLLLDEIDKIAREGNRGDCTSILLDILDSNRSSFVDNYIQAPFNLSEVIFICTANDTNKISKPLIDRMEHIKLSGYNYEEKLEIAKRFIVPKKLNESGLKELGYCFDEDATRILADNCQSSMGVRTLERLVTAVCRRAALKHLQNQMISKVITKDFILDQNILPVDEKMKEKKIGFYIEDSL